MSDPTNLSPTNLSIWQRSTVARFFRWLFSWRGLRCVVAVLAWTVTMIALLYAEENWRGRHAWNKYRQELEAGGAQLDLRALLPKPVPDEQNFAATPWIKSWFPKNSPGNSWGGDFGQAQSMVPASRTGTDRAERHLLDLGAWEMAFAALQSGEKLDRKQKFESDKFDRETRAKAARAVLDELKPSEPYLAELSAASQRPYARYQVNYDLENPWGILLPHLAGIKTVCQRLQLRACASLAAGQSEAALADVKLMLYLGDSIRDEFFLISYLVRLAILQQAAQPIWEGLAEHRWAEAQLQELQTRLLEYDLLTDMKHPLEGERAAGILTAELLSRQKCQLSNLLGDANPSSSALADLLGRIAPHGWYYLEQLNYCRFYEQQLGGTFDREKRRIFPAQIASHAHEFEREIGGGRLGKGAHAALHHRFLATLLLPSLGKVTIKTAMVQTALDQAALACALERYRLANGRFPENLDALQARFLAQLPHDLITGEPYRYRRTDDGQFLLHSVGWDEKDDGGVPGKVLFDDKRGDWVWQYPSR